MKIDSFKHEEMHEINKAGGSLLNFPKSFRITIYNFINEFDLAEIDKKLLEDKDIAYKIEHDDYVSIVGVVTLDAIYIEIELTMFREKEGYYEEDKNPVVIAINVPRNEIDLLLWGCFDVGNSPEGGLNE
jgi:hypothetical protein